MEEYSKIQLKLRYQTCYNEDVCTTVSRIFSVGKKSFKKQSFICIRAPNNEEENEYAFQH
jgi:hypothetical protein